MSANDWIYTIVIEGIGWLSTTLFLISILMPRRIHLHTLGIFTSITTGIYAYSHGATAIWVKWAIALFFHIWMWIKLGREGRTRAQSVNAGANTVAAAGA